MASLSGRFMHLLSTRLPGVGKWTTRRHIDKFRSSNGQKGNKIMGIPAFLLDVVGRSSGEPRPVMLILTRRDDDIIVIGSHAGNPQAPNWWKNLMAAGTAHVEVGAERWAVDAVELPDGEERDQCWQLACDVYPDFASYQELTDRKIPVGLLTRRP